MHPPPTPGARRSPQQGRRQRHDARQAALARRRRTYRVRVRRRRAVLVAVLAVVLVLIAIPIGKAATQHGPKLTALESRIVAAANSQLGYRTNPQNSYCNRFSAYWGAGAATCPPGERSEEWCADFAAWVWHRAGVRFTWGYGDGEINGASVSFYEWAVAHHAWHPASPGYSAAAGDIAVYGLVLSPAPAAVHVAVVTSDPPGQLGPNVVNGDGDRTGFSVVETGTDQVLADVTAATSRLSGYVVAPEPPRRHRKTPAS